MRPLMVTHPTSRLDLFLSLRYSELPRMMRRRALWTVSGVLPDSVLLLLSDKYSHFPPAWFAVNMGTSVFWCTGVPTHIFDIWLFTMQPPCLLSMATS